MSRVATFNPLPTLTEGAADILKQIVQLNAGPKRTKALAHYPLHLRCCRQIVCDYAAGKPEASLIPCTDIVDIVGSVAVIPRARTELEKMRRLKMPALKHCTEGYRAKLPLVPIGRAQ